MPSRCVANHTVTHLNALHIWQCNHNLCTMIRWLRNTLICDLDLVQDSFVCSYCSLVLAVHCSEKIFNPMYVNRPTYTNKYVRHMAQRYEFKLINSWITTCVPSTINSAPHSQQNQMQTKLDLKPTQTCIHLKLVHRKRLVHYYIFAGVCTAKDLWDAISIETNTWLYHLRTTILVQDAFGTKSFIQIAMITAKSVMNCLQCEIYISLAVYSRLSVIQAGSNPVDIGNEVFG